MKQMSIAVIGVLALICGLSKSAEAVSVRKHMTHELVFTAATSPANPFDMYLLKIEVTDPGGRKFTIDGFYDGDGKGGQNGTIWKARLSPYMAGLWSWRTIPADAPDSGLIGLSGQFNCIESDDLGGLVAERQNFRFQEGDYIYLLGNFLDQSVRYTHLYMSENISNTERAAIARNRDFRASNKINVYFANVVGYSRVPVSPWLEDDHWNFALDRVARIGPRFARQFARRWRRDAQPGNDAQLSTTVFLLTASCGCQGNHKLMFQQRNSRLGTRH